MIRRFIALPAIALPALLAILFSSHSALAQTRPRVTVPVEEPSQARAIVQQLLRDGRIIRSSEVKRGMKGFARSVFQGTEIEEFPIEVIGVLEKVQGGGDIVLIRVTGGTVVRRNSGIVAGMSGSPVYINGKMLGAIALGWGFPKEPIGGVTPITEMIETSLPDNRKVEEQRLQPFAFSLPPSDEYRPKTPLRLAGRDITRAVISRDARHAALAGPAHGATMTLRPTTTLLQVGGMRPEAIGRLRQIFEPYQVTPVIGPSSQKNVPAPPIKPGSAMGVQLVSGDMDQTAIGTVTFRWGDRVLGFGHPMFGQGPSSIPLAAAYVHDIFPSYERSFKLASPIAVLGALQQDTQFAVGGTLNAVADTIPMSVSLSDKARGIQRTFKVKVMKDPVLTPQLISVVASEAIETTLGLTSDKMVTVGMRMRIDGAPDIVRRNLLYTQGTVTPAAIADLRQSLLITQQNEFARGSIRSVDLTVAVEDSRRIATITEIAANRNRVRAGETVQINVRLEPVTTPNTYITRTFDFKVPDDAPDGVLRVVAVPGTSYWAGQVQAGGPPPEPANLRELVEAWNKVGAFNELVVEVSTPQSFLQVDDKKLPNPPPAWASLMRATRSTSIATYNEVETQRVFTEMSLSGGQILTIPVESKGYRGENQSAATTVETTAEPDSATPQTPATPDDLPGTPASGDEARTMGSTSIPSLHKLNDMVAAGALRQGDVFGSYQSRPWHWEEFDDARLEQPAPFVEQIAAWRETAGSTSREGSEVVNAAAGTEPSTLQNTAPKSTPMQVGMPPRVVPDKPVTGSVAAPTPAPTAQPTPTVKPTPTPEIGKSVARPASSWVQGSVADFLKGDFTASLVTSDGRIEPASPSRLLTTTAEPFVWSIAADGSGNTYLGTGNTGDILRVDAKDRRSVFYDSSRVAVTALTTDAAGNVYAGFSPGGEVLRLDPDGQVRTIFNTPDTFVWAVAWDDQQRLLIGTGGESGKVYRVEDAATRVAPAPATPLVSLPQKHVRALASRGDELFIGTGDEGVLWQVEANGNKTTLFQVPGAAAGKTTATTSTTPAGASVTTISRATGSEVLAIAAAPEGIYFGTSANGTIYRWNEKGVEELYASPQQVVYALQRDAAGRIYAATGNSGVVYQMVPGAGASDTQAARLLEPTQLQALTLALAPDNKDLLIGTGNNGAAYRVALSSTPEGKFTSPVFDAQNTVNWGALRLIGAGVTVETRSGNTSDPDASWSDWQPAQANDLGEYQTPSPVARYLQYRALLNPAAPEAATPYLSRLEIVYRSRNSAPLVAFATAPDGAYWSGKQTVKWSGSDPDKDALNYQLLLSSDGGQTFRKVEMKDDEASTFTLDTSDWPDGVYRAKIEASDRARNPEDPQSASILSAPFTIDNTPPNVDSISLLQQPDQTLTLNLTATDTRSPLAGAEWRWAYADDEKTGPAQPDTNADVKTDARATTDTKAKDDKSTDDKTKMPDNPWRATAASDGIFDSRRESLIALLPPYPTVSAPPVDKAADEAANNISESVAVRVPVGVEVRVHDAAGNTVTQRVLLP